MAITKTSNQITFTEHKKIVEIQEWYLASSKNTGVTFNGENGGWSTTVPSLNSTNKYLWNCEVVKYSLDTDDVSTPAIIGVYGTDGAPGASATFAFLSNENITLSANSNGEIAGMTFPTEVFAYTGTTPETVTISEIIGCPSGITYNIPEGTSVINFTVEDKATLGTNENTSGTIRVTITEPIETTLDLTWSKVNSGATGADGTDGRDGADAKYIKLDTTHHVLKINKDSTYSPSTITITPTITAPSDEKFVWCFSNDGGQSFWANLNNLGINMFRYDAENKKYVTITSGTRVTQADKTYVTIDGAAFKNNNNVKSIVVGFKDEADTYRDLITIYKASDGADGVDGKDGVDGTPASIVFLTNENVTFSADSEGKIFNTTFSTNVVGYSGDTAVLPTLGTITGLVDGEINIDSTTNDGKEHTINFSIDDGSTLQGATSGVINIPITSPIQTTLKLTWNRVNYGADGANGESVRYVKLNTTSHVIKTNTDGSITPSEIIITPEITTPDINDKFRWQYSTDGGQTYGIPISGVSNAILAYKNDAVISKLSETQNITKSDNTYLKINTEECLNYGSIMVKFISTTNGVNYEDVITIHKLSDGENGADGRGISNIVNYYAITSDTNPPNENDWLTTISQIDSINKYLWNYEEISYTDGDPTTTDPAIIGVYGDSVAASYTVFLTNENELLAANSSGKITQETKFWTDIVAYSGTTREKVTVSEILGIPNEVSHTITGDNTENTKIEFTVPANNNLGTDDSCSNTIEIKISEPIVTSLYLTLSKVNSGADGKDGIDSSSNARKIELRTTSHIIKVNKDGSLNPSEITITPDITTPDANETFGWLYSVNGGAFQQPSTTTDGAVVAYKGNSIISNSNDLIAITKSDNTCLKINTSKCVDYDSLTIRFFTTNHLPSYNDVITIHKLSDGTDPVTFEIYSNQGFVFKEDVESIELKTAAFDGTTAITKATYQWQYWNEDAYVNISGATSSTFTVSKSDTYAFAGLRCQMTYNSKTYYDYVSLLKETTIYTSVVKFFDGSNIFYADDQYIVAYIELYENNDLIETIEADKYCTGVSTLSGNTIIANITESFSEGDKMYFVCEENGLYKVILGQAVDGEWKVIENNMNYIYQNSLYESINSNVIAISKESINKSQKVDFEVYKDANTRVAVTSANIIDSNDPVISSSPPENPVFKQLWLDTSVSPYILKIYTQTDDGLGEWVDCSDHTGGSVFMSKPSSYKAGDLWILAEGEECDKYDENGNVCGTYSSGSMLKARVDSSGLPMIAYLTNENVILAADSSGRVHGTTFTTDVVACSTMNLASSVLLGDITGLPSAITYTTTSGLNGKQTITFTVQDEVTLKNTAGTKQDSNGNYYGTITIPVLSPVETDLTLKWTQVDGIYNESTGAKNIVLNATNQVIKVNGDGTISPSTIKITPTISNVESGENFYWRDSIDGSSWFSTSMDGIDFYPNSTSAFNINSGVPYAEIDVSELLANKPNAEKFFIKIRKNQGLTSLYYEDVITIHKLSHSSTFNAADWIDADEELTKLQEISRQYLRWDANDGLTIGQQDQMFHVNIDAQEMGFYDNTSGLSQKVVCIGTNSTSVNNLTVYGDDAEFNCTTVFNEPVQMFGFMWQKEDNESLSLVVVVE